MEHNVLRCRRYSSSLGPQISLNSNGSRISAGASFVVSTNSNLVGIRLQASNFGVVNCTVHFNLFLTFTGPLVVNRVGINTKVAITDTFIEADLERGLSPELLLVLEGNWGIGGTIRAISVDCTFTLSRKSACTDHVGR